TCDQFAAAVALYESLTGDRFYGDMNTHQIWQVVGMGGFVPRKWLEVDADISPLLSRALEADPKKRFPTCDAFRDALDDVRARKHPRANKSALREVMRALYGDRADAERDLIASFADLRAPDPAATAGAAPHSSAPVDVSAQTVVTPKNPTTGTE